MNYITCSQSAKVLESPKIAEILLTELAKQIKSSGLSIDCVCSPAIGGILAGYELARALGVNFIFTERVNGVMNLRRGFAELLLRQPETTVVCNDKTAVMIAQFFGRDATGKMQLVKEGDTLSTGAHELAFYLAPMIHWPEVMMTYDKTARTLFTADAFGVFGALNGAIFADEVDFDRDYLKEARRYYTNIVGKYGVQVQNLFKKIAGLDIAMLCPLHGFVWRENLGYILEKYTLWIRKLFGSSQFLKVLRNTLEINFLKILCLFPLPILCAILLNEIRNRIYQKLCQTMIYVPYFFSWVLIFGIFYSLLGSYGIVNSALNALVLFWLL